MPDSKANDEQKIIQFMSVEAVSLMPDGTLGLVGNAIFDGEEVSRRVILKCAVQTIIPLPPSPPSYGRSNAEIA